ncbi:MAG: DUF3109 family protein [Bacteroidetes bacterium]|nr:DUF3109 family protein [Bacteroidota bacterium]
MLQIENTIVSLDIPEKKFYCDLKSCRGACCIQGESGAPLTDEETGILNEIFPVIKPFMQEDGIRTVEKHGIFVIDSDNEKVTPLIEGRECAFAAFKDNIAYCTIEYAYQKGLISFRKPVSCHLFPVRVKEYKDFTAVNFEDWKTCRTSGIYGEIHGIPLHEFLKEALIRRFGREWYDRLKYSADHLDEIMSIKNRN